MRFLFISILMLSCSTENKPTRAKDNFEPPGCSCEKEKDLVLSVAEGTYDATGNEEALKYFGDGTYRVTISRDSVSIIFVGEDAVEKTYKLKVKSREAGEPTGWWD